MVIVKSVDARTSFSEVRAPMRRSTSSIFKMKLLIDKYEEIVVFALLIVASTFDATHALFFAPKRIEGRVYENDTALSSVVVLLLSLIDP